MEETTSIHCIAQSHQCQFKYYWCLPLFTRKNCAPPQFPSRKISNTFHLIMTLVISTARRSLHQRLLIQWSKLTLTSKILTQCINIFHRSSSKNPATQYHKAWHSQSDPESLHRSRLSLSLELVYALTRSEKTRWKWLRKRNLLCENKHPQLSAEWE